MERSNAAVPRRMSIRGILASAVTAIMAGKRIEFSGRGSRAMQRKAEKIAAQQKSAANPKLFGPRRYGPVWIGKPRPMSHPRSLNITASY